MSSKKFTATILSALVALTVIVGGGLAVIHTNDTASAIKGAKTLHHTTVSYQGIAGANALTLLKQKHHVQTKTYSGMGEEVVGIDGVLADSKHYWAFYVNGKMAQVGAGSYTTKTSDMLTWKLAAL